MRHINKGFKYIESYRLVLHRIIDDYNKHMILNNFSHAISDFIILQYLTVKTNLIVHQNNYVNDVNNNFHVMKGILPVNFPASHLCTNDNCLFSCVQSVPYK